MKTRGVAVILLCLAVVCSLCSCSSISRGRGALGVGAPALYAKLSKALDAKGTIKPSQSLVIYSCDGAELGRAYGDNRTYVALKDIPKNLRDATVAIEDNRFYSHGGVDARGIARAIWRDVRGGKLAEGGSTITQQLVRNVCLTHSKTFKRKIEEAALAIKVERSLTKDEILELYLNQIYYGGGAYGVEAASQAYFGKSVGELNLSECALIAGLPQSPSYYSRNPKQALKRRNTVLDRMAELNYISTTERDRAKRERLSIQPNVSSNSLGRAPHFVQYVLSELRGRYSESDLQDGGLKVYTTLNYRMQRIAERALREGIRRNSRALHVSEGCLVCIDPETGYIRAMVGGVNPKSEYNRCTQGHGRQPGSSFKLFVYAAAMEAGLKPSDTIVDEPVSYPGAAGEQWTPTNDDNRYHGRVTLMQAFSQSMNIPAIKIADRVGINNVIRIAHAAGVESDLEPNLTTAIGGVKGVHPLEMASAYGTFANDGIHAKPMAILRITNWRGDTIERFHPVTERAVSGDICRSMDSMLRQVVVGAGGTGRRAGGVSEARGKTGTTNDDRDAWFVGYVPGKLVTACWAGNDNNSPMRHVFGGSVCAPIWRQFMLQAIPICDRSYHRSRRCEVPQEAPNPVSITETTSTAPDVTEQSDTVTCKICDESGMLATDQCPATHEQDFTRGTEPKETCTMHPAASQQ